MYGEYLERIMEKIINVEKTLQRNSISVFKITFIDDSSIEVFQSEGHVYVFNTVCSSVNSLCYKLNIPELERTWRIFMNIYYDKYSNNAI